MDPQVDESKKMIALINQLPEVPITDDPAWKELVSVGPDRAAAEKIRDGLIAKYALGKSPVIHRVFLQQRVQCLPCQHTIGDGFCTIMAGDLTAYLRLTECDIHHVLQHGQRFSHEQLEVLKKIFKEGQGGSPDGCAFFSPLDSTEKFSFEINVRLRTGEPESKIVFFCGADDNYRLVFIDGVNQKEQTIRLRNSVPVRPGDVFFEDLNGDSYKELRLIGGVDPAEETWYKTWIFDGPSRTFRWLEMDGASDNGKPEPDRPLTPGADEPHQDWQRNGKLFFEHLSLVEPGWPEKRLVHHAGLPTEISSGEWQYQWHESLGGLYHVFSFKIHDHRVVGIRYEHGCEMTQ